MKTSPMITRIASATGIALGAFAISALAATWTAPVSAPPANNIDAPVNIGSLQQVKAGILGVVGLVTNNFKMTTGAANGYVLTSDADGDAAWAPAGGGSPWSAGIFKFKRSAEQTGDAVIWCPTTHPYVVSCDVVDNQAPAAANLTDLTNPCKYQGGFGQTPTRTTDGGCIDLDGSTTDPAKRGDLGANNVYLERVRQTSGVYGCMAYDHLHAHTPYKIDLTCSQ